MLFDTELETDKGQMILQPSQWAQTFFRGDAASKVPEPAEQQSTGSPFVDWSAIPNDLAGLSDEEIGSLPMSFVGCAWSRAPCASLCSIRATRYSVTAA